jgi:hypothetical protein
MSLDVHLYGSMTVAQKPKIMVRRNGSMVEITRAEWDVENPGTEPVVFNASEDTNEVFWRNITHNLGAMAREAGIYQHLWRPEELSIAKASQLIDPLWTGLCELIGNRKKYEEFNPSNGWGDYEGLVAFVRAYWEACKEYPDAIISVSR